MIFGSVEIVVIKTINSCMHNFVSNMLQCAFPKDWDFLQDLLWFRSRYLEFLKIKLENCILFHFSIKKVIKSTLRVIVRNAVFVSSTFLLVCFGSLKKELAKDSKMFSISLRTFFSFLR